jgi:hypothetical protein
MLEDDQLAVEISGVSSVVLVASGKVREPDLRERLATPDYSD